MTRFISSLSLSTLLGLCLLVAPAHAQLARTFVSSMGNDANDCGRLTPCRTFQRAHDQTLTLGEITVLDPGGYGAVNITKGISIINDGVGEAGVLVSGGLVGITINAGSSDRVSLRGLTVKGIGFGGGNGIRFNTGLSLTIENSVVRNHTGDGIQMVGNVPANAESSFILSNTLVADNGGNAIYVQPGGAGLLKVILNRVEMYGNGAHGLGMTNPTASATVLDSVSAVNGFSGFAVTNHATLVVLRSVAVYNRGNGLGVDNAVLRIGETRASSNHQGDLVCANGGFVGSSQDNLFLTTDNPCGKIVETKF